jgi:hypothetical protein
MIRQIANTARPESGGKSTLELHSRPTTMFSFLDHCSAQICSKISHSAPQPLTQERSQRCTIGVTNFGGDFFKVDTTLNE